MARVKHKPVVRKCKDCGADISGTTLRLRCDKCKRKKS